MSDDSIESFEQVLASMGYPPRAAQASMAAKISSALTTGTDLVVEAATGTGKTFAYLVPALLSDKKVIISTGTKNLQDQIFFNDLPRLKQSTGFRKRIALLKGRGNYLCPQRLETALRVRDRVHNMSDLDVLHAVQSWSYQSNQGDLSEIEHLFTNYQQRAQVTSTTDNCLGTQCPKYEICPVYRARAFAKEADLVLVNHHLLFADLILREESTGQILPSVDCIVVDEAHQVSDIARRFFATTLSSRQFLELGRDVLAEMVLLSNDDRLLIVAAELMISRTREVIKHLQNHRSDAPEWLLQQSIDNKLFRGIDEALDELTSTLNIVQERSPGLKRCFDRALELTDRFVLLTEHVRGGSPHFHFLELLDNGFTLQLSQLEVAEELRSLQQSARQNWIYTSATLTVSAQFDYFTQQMGLTDLGKDSLLVYESPFAFYEQAKLYLPEDLPDPGDSEFTVALVERCLPLIRHNAGKCFFLFTSHRAMGIAAQILALQSDMPVLTQGTLGKQAMIEKFYDLENCVLLGTYSFWEGVDVMGAGLSLLIIDKLPFRNPSDPWTAGQRNAITAAGGDAFLEYFIPEAVITLRQGFGRLIRQESDRGLFVLGDPRVYQRSYGDLFLQSLPKMPILRSRTEALTYIQEIAQ